MALDSTKAVVLQPGGMDGIRDVLFWHMIWSISRHGQSQNKDLYAVQAGAMRKHPISSDMQASSCIIHASIECEQALAK